MKSISEIKIKGALHSYGEGEKEKIEAKSEKKGISFWWVISESSDQGEI